VEREDSKGCYCGLCPVMSTLSEIKGSYGAAVPQFCYFRHIRGRGMHYFKLFVIFSGSLSNSLSETKKLDVNVALIALPSLRFLSYLVNFSSHY
jgi:hypothetical protein